MLLRLLIISNQRVHRLFSITLIISWYTYYAIAAELCMSIFFYSTLFAPPYFTRFNVTVYTLYTITKYSSILYQIICEKQLFSKTINKFKKNINVYFAKLYIYRDVKVRIHQNIHILINCKFYAIMCNALQMTSTLSKEKECHCFGALSGKGSITSIVVISISNTD